ncbi:MAG: hypothetical protein A3E56_02280 [Omnitrophica WOR_2 bacterium RIFCSPHIGHO2_12_FULL_64_13]|nr:MAG: hypothetical protein A3E56_02280 [Omnitrophica WOR_2 bacterium RIFCSPHIGHO2_12_FULL_64_13]
MRVVPTCKVALAVVERRKRYLICRRRADAHFGGYWEFPGGKKEARESWEACLRRELREELGVSVRALRGFGRLQHRYPDRRISFRIYRCQIARGRPKPLGTADIRWATAEELPRYRFPPADLALIARLTEAGSLPRRRRHAILTRQRRNRS